MRTLGVGLVCALLATGSAEARSRTSPRAGTPTGVADSPEHAAPIVADEATSPGCPLRIVPGKSFGPIRLSMSRGELDDLGVHVGDLAADPSANHRFATVGPLRVELLYGKVADIWLDDLREGPDCVFLEARRIPRHLPREKLIGWLKGCGKEEKRKGGAFIHCSSGVTLGWGVGEMLQIRVSADGLGVADGLYEFLD